RPVLIGLLYVLLWEGMLVRLLTGTSVLSVQQYGLRIAHDISGTSVVTPHVSLPMAITMSCCAVVSAFVVAVERLRSFSIVGGE
ncbi:MAG: ABC transporter permease, partial [Micromonosporaceae bacterium]|nr:ABC transporter permease [Micromonosporaceae bacterium]